MIPICGAFPEPSVSFLRMEAWGGGGGGGADGGVEAGQRVIDDGIFQLVVGILRALFGNLGYRYVGDVHNSLLFLLSVGIFPAEKFLIRVI